MAYQFTNQPIASAKVQDPAGGTGLDLSLKCINGTESAPVIVDGFKGLLYIANRLNDYEPTHTTRVVTQNVDDDNS